MKKLLFILLGVIIISVIVQKFGLLTYFLNNSKPTTEIPSVNTPTTEISQVINRPVIGIHYRMIDKQTAVQNKLVEGAYITQIIKGSSAEKANLQEEDIIIEVDNNKIGGTDEQILTKLISEKKPGEIVILKIWRNKEIKTIFVTLETAQ